MKDLGFGILDRRTVIVALLTIVIANVFFQFSLPIRLGNAADFFIDLVLFTGYLYLAHSLLRLLVIVFLFFTTILSDHIHKFAWSHNITEMTTRKQDSRLKIVAYKTMYVLMYSIKSIFLAVITMPIIVFSSSDYEAEIINAERSSKIMERPNFLRVFERISLVAIIIFATIPQYAMIAQKTGAVGIIVIILVYLFKGNFTFFIRDKIAEDVAEKKPLRKKIIR